MIYTKVEDDGLRYWNIMHELVKLPIDLQVNIRDWLINNPEIIEYEQI